MLRVSVVIPVHNGGTAFRRCLDGLRRSTHAPFEVLVVSDGSTDDSAEVARHWGAHVLEQHPAHGPAVARNRGAALASGDVLLFLDADVEPHATTVGQVAAAFAADPTLDALVGSYDDAPGRTGFLSQYRNLLHHFTHQRAASEATTFWGACGAIRPHAFHAVGGFDERYRHPSIEDVELGERLYAAGFTLRLRPDIQVKHWKRWRAAGMLRTDLLARAAPWTRLILQRGVLRDDLSTGWSARGSVVTALALPIVLVASFWIPALLPLAAACGLLLVGLNASFYRFLLRKRGSLFTLRALPWHWAYYVCAGLGFGVGALSHLTRRAPAPPQPVPSAT